MILRWVCSVLIFLIASGGMMQHGQAAERSDMPGLHIAVSTAEVPCLDMQERRRTQQAPASDMSDPCAIICLGTPMNWLTSTQFAPVETERSLKRRFAAVAHEGRLVDPGYRPPKSI